MKLKIKLAYKVGINEVEGLKSAMTDALKPIQKHLKNDIYWSDVSIEETEYLSRDGFMAYSSNCGGVEISEIIPECESHDFQYLEFGEWDGFHHCDEKDTDNCECSYANEGEYDAKLRIWLKFEGIENDEMHFYLYAGGGNGDAPYFRVKHEVTVFESEFTAKSIAGFKLAARNEVTKLLKKLGGAA